MRRDFHTWRRTSDGLTLFSTSKPGALATMVPDPRDGRLWRVRFADGTVTDAMSFTLAKDTALQRTASRPRLSHRGVSNFTRRGARPAGPFSHPSPIQNFGKR